MTDRIRYAPDPADPDWMVWEIADPEVRASGFNAALGHFQVRPEGPGAARCRIIPGKNLANIAGHVHGGALMGFIDVALFAGARACGVETAASAMTLDCSVQFIGAIRIGTALDARVELLRETGRLVFVRGIVEQEGTSVAAFSGTLRKSTAAG